MNRETKIQSFEFILFILIQLYEKKGSKNDLSILKSMKLLFFISTIKVEDNDLLDVFNNYSALPLGPVEMDIYDAIKNDELSFFILNNTNTILKNKNSLSINEFKLIDNEFRHKILNSIQKLLEENSNIIFLKAFDLVELSHEWFSWKFYFNKAKSNNSLKMSIPIDIIRSEPKIFHSL